MSPYAIQKGRPPNRTRRAQYEGQEPGDGSEPEIRRPPDDDISDFDPDDLSDHREGPGAPPFTGEDVEDTGEPTREHHRTNPVDMFLG